jgi:hypothetical protein
MSDISSNSSDSESICSEENHELTLNEVNEMVREYEKTQKRDRKKRFDAKVLKSEVAVDLEKLSQIQLTKKQLKQLEAKEKKERTEKQKAQVAALNEKRRIQIDARKDKEKEGVVLKIKPKLTRQKKVKEEEIEIDEIEEPKKSKFQAKKPKVEDSDDELDKKVNTLNKINSVLESTNPYLAMVMASRMRK